jgi:hypothetical protein
LCGRVSFFRMSDIYINKSVPHMVKRCFLG